MLHNTGASETQVNNWLWYVSVYKHCLKIEVLSPDETLSANSQSDLWVHRFSKMHAELTTVMTHEHAT